MTGEKTPYWAEKAGRTIKETIESFEDDEEGLKKQCIVNMILSESTKGFLSKDYSILRKIGITKEKMKPAYEARNSFYEACYNNESIQGIGFTDEDEFPIQRNDFLAQIVPLPPNNEDNEGDNWTVEIVDIIATSPNWDQFDGQRSWKAKYPKGRPWAFSLEDELFWALIQHKKIEAGVPDFMKAQLAFVEEGSRRKKNRVLRVIEFNGVKISRPLDQQELADKLGAFKKSENAQLGMFDE